MKFAALILVLGVVLAGCDETVPPATLFTFATFCTAENNNQRVGLEGYAYVPLSLLVSDTMSLNLHELPDRGGAVVSFDITVGNGNNMAVEPPNNFTDADLLIRATDGTQIRSVNRIRVKGKLQYNPTGSAPSRFDCKLSTPTRVYTLADE